MTNPKHRLRLNAAYNEFNRLIRGLPENVLQLRLTSLANKSAAEADPFISALARRELEALSARKAVSEAQQELAGLRRIPDDVHYPGQPDKRAQQAARKEELERSINLEVGRQLTLAQDPLLDAQREAIAEYEREDAAAERRAAIMGRVEEKKAAAAEAALDAAADRVLRGQSIDKSGDM